MRHEAVVEASRVQAPLAALIKEIGGGPKSARDLDTRRAQALFSAMLAGEVPPLELGAILIALRIKGESLPEMIGFLRALDEAVGRLDADPERPRPVVLPSYNGARRHPNLTALLALLLRRYGVPVVIHGPDGHSADDGADGEDAEAQSIAIDPRAKRVTTLDVLRALGIEPAASMADAQRMLERQSLAYVPTLVLAPSLATLLACRDRLGVRSCAHSLAKLIDPFHGDAVRVVSVTHPAYLERMRELLVATRVRALLLRATEGEPYANPLRQVQIEAYADGIGTVCAEKECGSVTEPPRLPALDAGATAAWIAEALDGTVAVPASIVAQLACCLDATRRI